MCCVLLLKKKKKIMGFMMLLPTIFIFRLTIRYFHCIIGKSFAEIRKKNGSSISEI